MSERNIALREAPVSSIPKVKKHPQESVIAVPFAYAPADDGTDENLLILLHGLGK